MQIGLLPLDERPVNTRYPVMLGAIAGAAVELPPQLGRFREPADPSLLIDWLDSTASNMVAHIVSFEMLGYGGLIPSRLTHEPAANVITRLEYLRNLHGSVLGFNVITRINRYNDATEEPGYWADYGEALYALSQAMHREGELPPTDVPRAIREDFLRRRLRNHTVNLAALELLADHALDMLVISSDDTGDVGLNVQEKDWLQTMASRFDFGDRLLMYPGADEVGSVLVTRLLNQHYERRPCVHPVYIVPEGRQHHAPYEDVPVEVTVTRQLRAAGCIEGDESAEAWLFINPPLPDAPDWLGYTEPIASHEPHLDAALHAIEQALSAGKQVWIADVAYPNGSDPLLMDKLLARFNLDDLSAYGGWNTAGNTIGTVVAQGCIPKRDADAQRRLLWHRLVEDWLYQRVVRIELRDWLQQTVGSYHLPSEWVYEARARITSRLNAHLAGLDAPYRVENVHLPWSRLFEVDFVLV